MAYTDYTSLDQIRDTFDITTDHQAGYFSTVEPAIPSDWLSQTILRLYNNAVSINTEASRQSGIVDNVVSELQTMNPGISYFIKKLFKVNEDLGLTGYPDVLVCKSADQLTIQRPVLLFVEAKNNNIADGYAQCIAEMIAAQQYNNTDSLVFGAVTDGVLWHFLVLEKRKVIIDNKSYLFDSDIIIGKQVLGILRSFIL